MFSSKVQLLSPAIRSEKELKSKVPIGGTFFIIYSKAHTDEPMDIVCVRREGAAAFSFGGDEDEEDCMPTIWNIRGLTEAPYGGAWLKKKDAKAYLALLQDCWKQTASAISTYAQSQENKLSQ